MKEFTFSNSVKNVFKEAFIRVYEERYSFFKKEKYIKSKNNRTSNSNRSTGEDLGGNSITLMDVILYLNINVLLESSIPSHIEEDEDGDNSRLNDESINCYM